MNRGDVATGILIVGFNRPGHLSCTLQAVFGAFVNYEVQYVIAIDGIDPDLPAIAKANNQLCFNLAQRYVEDTESTELIVQESNLGLCRHMEQSINYMSNRFESFVVIEDDVVVTPQFSKFVLSALHKYESTPRVMHIGGYAPFTKDSSNTAVFSSHMNCWGWATWSDRWKQHYQPNAKVLKDLIKERDLARELNMGRTLNGYFRQLAQNANGALCTWAIKWKASILVSEGLCLYPRSSVVSNIGHDGSGTNSANDIAFNSRILVGTQTYLPSEIAIDREYDKKHRAALARANSVTRKLRRLLIRIAT